MVIRIGSTKVKEGLKQEMERMSGVSLASCYQCRRCTAGCPVSKQSGAAPSEIIRRLHLGAGAELLENGLVWMCLSCETCYGRCPMQINFPAVVDAMRSLCLERGVTPPRGNMPLFNRQFLDNVRRFGRSYDLAMIAGYKLGSGNLMQDTGKFPAMLVKGKIALLPPMGAEKQAVRQIFDRVKKGGEVQS